MKTRLLVLSVAIAAIALAQPLGAVTDTKGITVSAAVSATAKITLSRATVAFVDADPDTTSSIPATGGAVTVDAKGKTSAGSNITLTLQAAGDLTSGSDTIPIGAVSWTATGDLSGGTMATTAVNVGTWANSGARTGTLSFVLANSWNYKTGNYTANATYTLTAP